MKPVRRQCELSILIVKLIGGFMYLSFFSGVALLLLRPGVSEALVTAMIVAPASNALSGLLTYLVQPNKDVQAVTVENPPSSPVPTEEAKP